MLDITKLFLIVLAFVIVSLDATYGITYPIFGQLLGASSKLAYGTGMALGNSGFLLHVVVFAALVAVVMMYF
jgi:hypothetical protein